MTSRHDRERREALERQLASKPNVGDAAAIYRQHYSTPAPTVANPAMVKTATVATPAPEPLPMAPVVKSATVARSATVRPEPKEGYLRLPYTVLDNLLRALEPAEQLVYLRIYRLIAGFKDRESCVVSYETLGQACNLGKRTVVRAVEGLERKGLVERFAVIDGRRAERGNRYRLLDAPVVKTATVAESATVATVARMKGSEEKKQSETAPLDKYALRTKAARLVELHHADALPYSHARLVADLHTALVAEGLEPDERLIEMATKGMGG